MKFTDYVDSVIATGDEDGKVVHKDYDGNGIDPIKINCVMDYIDIIQGVSRKYTSRWVDKGDLEQELWCRLMYLVEYYGDNLNKHIVAKSMFNQAVTVYRQERKSRENRKMFIDEMHRDDYVTPFFKVDTVQELKKLFPKGSVERKYMLTKLLLSGDIDEKDIDMEDEGVFIPSSDKEIAIIREVLGFSSDRPGTLYYKKQSMKHTIEDFLFA